MSETFDSEMYSAFNGNIEKRARDQVHGAIDTDGLVKWFIARIRDAYQSGLRDGYIQGRHATTGPKEAADV